MCKYFAPLFALLVALLVSAASAQEASPRIHVLIVGDTNDPSIGVSVKADVDHVREMFLEHVPRKQLTFSVLTGGRATPQQILSAIEVLPAARGRDTVVVYFSGHGYFGADSKDHVLFPQRRNLPRARVRTALQQLQARECVLITDTCSEVIRRPPKVGAPPEATEVSPLFASLFLAPRGLVDISATKPGEAALGDFGGGYFTMSFYAACFDHRNEKADWSKVVRWVNGTVSVTYKDAKQTAYAVSPLPGEQTPPAVEPVPAVNAAVGGWRFGAVATRTDRSARFNGVEITQVVPGSPATRLLGRGDGKTYSLVAGRDILLQLNGQPITSEEEFRSAIRNSPAQMTLRVYDLQVGAAADYGVELAGVRGGRFGVSAVATARSVQVGGVEVRQLVPAFPGNNLRNRRDGSTRRLVVGRDVITQVNGRPVRDYAAFVEAVNQSPREMTVRVYDLQTDTAEDYDVTLKR